MTASIDVGELTSLERTPPGVRLNPNTRIPVLTPMKPSPSIVRPAKFSTALLALACALCLGAMPVPAATAADTPMLRSLDDKAPALPLTPTFKKVDTGEDGPCELILENVSKDTIKASGKLYPSVGIHSDTKEKTLSEHVLAPGDTWTIPGLAATDKLTIIADGYAPLELTVP